MNKFISALLISLCLVSAKSWSACMAAKTLINLPENMDCVPESLVVHPKGEFLLLSSTSGSCPLTLIDMTKKNAQGLIQPRAIILGKSVQAFPVGRNWRLMALRTEAGGLSYHRFSDLLDKKLTPIFVDDEAKGFYPSLYESKGSTKSEMRLRLYQEGHQIRDYQVFFTDKGDFKSVQKGKFQHICQNIVKPILTPQVSSDGHEVVGLMGDEFVVYTLVDKGNCLQQEAVGHAGSAATLSETTREDRGRITFMANGLVHESGQVTLASMGYVFDRNKYEWHRVTPVFHGSNVASAESGIVYYVDSKASQIVMLDPGQNSYHASGSLEKKSCLNE